MKKFQSCFLANMDLRHDRVELFRGWKTVTIIMLKCMQMTWRPWHEYNEIGGSEAHLLLPLLNKIKFGMRAHYTLPTFFAQSHTLTAENLPLKILISIKVLLCSPPPHHFSQIFPTFLIFQSLAKSKYNMCEGRIQIAFLSDNLSILKLIRWFGSNCILICILCKFSCLYSSVCLLYTSRKSSKIACGQLSPTQPQLAK